MILVHFGIVKCPKAKAKSICEDDEKGMGRVATVIHIMSAYKFILGCFD